MDAQKSPSFCHSLYVPTDIITLFGTPRPRVQSCDLEKILLAASLSASVNSFVHRRLRCMVSQRLPYLVMQIIEYGICSLTSSLVNSRYKLGILLPISIFIGTFQLVLQQHQYIENCFYFVAVFVDNSICEDIVRYFKDA